ALDYNNQALPIHRETGDRVGEATTLKNIAAVYSSMREYQKALELINKALMLHRKVGTRSGEANTLITLGNVYASLGEPGKALDFYSQALELFRALGERSGEAQTLYNIGKVERDRNHFVDARSRLEAALNIVESLRNQVFSRELRTSYLASVKNY